MTDFPLPDNVKEVISRLPVKDQGECFKRRRRWWPRRRRGIFVCVAPWHRASAEGGAVGRPSAGRARWQIEPVAVFQMKAVATLQHSPDNSLLSPVSSPFSANLLVVLRSYIAGLRDQLKEYKVRAEHGDDDPHAHYHGHERCTSGEQLRKRGIGGCVVLLVLRCSHVVS